MPKDPEEEIQQHGQHHADNDAGHNGEARRTSLRPASECRPATGPAAGPGSRSARPSLPRRSARRRKSESICRTCEMPDQETARPIQFQYWSVLPDRLFWTGLVCPHCHGVVPESQASAGSGRSWDEQRQQVADDCGAGHTTSLCYAVIGQCLFGLGRRARQMHILFT